MKTQRTQIHFLSDVFVAVASLDLKVPNKEGRTRLVLTHPNREDKSLRHVSMVAKFLDDNKPKKSLKSLFALFQTSPILINFILTWQILEKFSLGPYLTLSKLRK